MHYHMTLVYLFVHMAAGCFPAMSYAAFDHLCQVVEW